MDERKRKVLQAIVNDYVATAEPVGSRTIAKKYQLGVSSATIRNEMSDLEELGYIEQPHTSAGRIPSYKGYRYFVDCLMEKETLPAAESAYIRNSFSEKMLEIEALLRQSCQMLSKLTNYTSMAIMPAHVSGKLEKIQILPVAPYQILLITIADTGMMVHRIVEAPQNLSAETWSEIASYLQNKLQGLDMRQINYTLLKELSLQVNQQQQVISAILDMIDQTLEEAGEEKVLLGGTVNMLNQPEFQDIEKVRNILSTLEENDTIKDLLNPEKNIGSHITIGSEMQHEHINYCSMVSATYHINGEIMGTVGVLGPTRMTYSKALSLVEAIAEQISENLGKKYGKEK